MRISDWSSDVCSSDLGMTVDRSHVLATPGLDAHGTSVALSRHRDGTAVHYGRDAFTDEVQLARTLGRERPKHMELDYTDRTSNVGDRDRKSISLNSRHSCAHRMPSPACKKKIRNS